MDDSVPRACASLYAQGARNVCACGDRLGRALAVDPENQTIYWTAHVPTRGTTIQRGRFDGTGVETIIDRLLHPKFIVIRPRPECDDGGPKGMLDTLGWEGYREGRDDARHLATL